MIFEGMCLMKSPEVQNYFSKNLMIILSCKELKQQEKVTSNTWKWEQNTGYTQLCMWIKKGSVWVERKARVNLSLGTVDEYDIIVFVRSYVYEM